MRLIRTKTISVPKESGFICGKCGATGDCADDREHALNCPNKGQAGFNFAFYWDKDAGEHGKIVCIKCNHWLETKKELETEIKVKEIQQYGFWLRFLSEHFIPCTNCQERIHELILQKETHLGSEDKPPVELWRRWEMISVEKKPNNAFVKEYCVICGRWFDANLNYIYECPELDGYTCYECGKKIE